jgi:peroxiredoxin
MDLENMELPEFSIQDLNGNLYTKSSMNGKVVIFSFWFTASNINVNELQALNQLAAEYKNNEQILWLAPALDNKDQLSRFLKDKGWVYRFAANQEDFALDLGVLAYPTHIIVDAGGNIHKAIVRSSKAQEVLENNITQLLN